MKLLIEELQLPYTDVKVCLDDLQGYNNHFWALAKIKAYQIMDVPFMHVDSDHRMRNLTAIFAKFLEICKDFSSNLVNESGNVSRRGVIPRFVRNDKGTSDNKGNDK